MEMDTLSLATLACIRQRLQASFINVQVLPIKARLSNFSEEIVIDRVLTVFAIGKLDVPIYIVRKVSDGRSFRAFYFNYQVYQF